MGSRNLAGVSVLVIGVFMLTGTASAHTTPPAPKKKPAVVEPTCVIHSLPSFMDQGEFGEASSVADVVEVECQPVYEGHKVLITATELYNRCAKNLSWLSPSDFAAGFFEGAKVEVTLDDDGNATAVLWGGPSCAAGESTISAHLTAAPYTTVAAPFTVLPPKQTTPSVRAEPAEQVEDDITSSVATIIEVEFPAVYAEQDVTIEAPQLFARCLVAPKLVWVGPDEHVLGIGVEGISKVKLDNDGNAFVVAIGNSSCAEGPSTIEASLEEAAYTTLETTFTIKAPEPTV
jgi:hypothetical protein